MNGPVVESGERLSNYRVMRNQGVKNEIGYEKRIASWARRGVFGMGVNLG